MIVGITGGTGCGKTTALDAIRQLGGLALDCDEIYHRLLETNKDLLSYIENRFPGVVENGSLHRKKLGSIVFADPKALSDLNKITHGAVRKEVEQLLQTAPELVAIDAIALFESGLDQLCDLTVAITAPEEVRISRLMARDGISSDYARSRIHAQPSQEAFSKKCDYTLLNDGSATDFARKCLAFFSDPVIMKEKTKGELI